MLGVINCIADDHDVAMVVIAGLICAIASATAFGFHRQSLKTREGLRAGWLFLAALVAGAGVWATHFIAMLAYQPSLKVAYEPVGTAASLILVVLGMAAAFATAARRTDRMGAIGGGMIAGAAVVGMHYVGIAAIRAGAVLELRPAPVVASILIALVLGAAAFVVVGRRSTWSGWIAGAALFILAVCGLHFTAMTAVELAPDPRIMVDDNVIGRGVLASATTAMTAFIIAAALALILLERIVQRSTLEGVRVALDAVPAGLVFYDRDGRLLNWNRAMAEFMRDIGVDPRRGMARASILEAATRAGWFAEVNEAEQAQFATDAAWRNRASDMRLPDGRWLRREDFPTDNGGVTVMTDVSEQRARTHAMAEARDAAQAASRAKSAFLANMSHEIRTPLNGVLGIAEVLGRTDLSARQQELVGVIQSSGSLLNALLADLLDLARVEAGVEGLRPERVDLSALAMSVAALFAGQAQAKGLSLEAQVDLGGQPWVEVDSRRLRQVLGNLLNNAVKFTDKGAVTLEVRRQGDAVWFAVRDTGPGFDEATKALLFGRFHQADETTTRRHGGAGLGLNICQQYVGMMGGTLDCDSAPGQGARFEFMLNLPKALAAAPEPPSVTTGPAKAERFRALIVDDNAVNRQVLGLILESFGLEHVFAEDGDQALQAVMNDPFDLVLMDIQMPVMDGLECTRRIRDWESRAGRGRSRICMVSANCLQEHVDAGVAAGADGHVAKPVSVASLLPVLQPHLPDQAAA